MIKYFGQVVRAFVLFAGTVATSQAALLTLDLDSNGNLLGANNVLVNGQYYDVDFLNGTCESLFNGCDSSDDFIWQARWEAVNAGRVLVDNVLTDFSPDEINGLAGNDGTFAQISIVSFEGLSSSNWNGGGARWNDPSALSAWIGYNTGSSTTFDTTSSSYYNYAVWSTPQSVPEPSTLLIASFGLLLVAFRRRNRLQG